MSSASAMSRPFEQGVSGASALSACRLSRFAGSLVEISGSGASGTLSTAMALVAEAQRREGEVGLTAWVASTRSLFFPPDAVRTGVCLDRLILLRLSAPAAQIGAATRLMQSGAFGLVVVDLAGAPRSAPALAGVSRLAGLTRRHRSALVVLTEKTAAAPSFDPRVMQRIDASRRGNRIVVTVVKDKGAAGALRRRPLPPGSRFGREYREPAGMC